MILFRLAKKQEPEEILALFEAVIEKEVIASFTLTKGEPFHHVLVVIDQTLSNKDAVLFHLCKMLYYWCIQNNVSKLFVPVHFFNTTDLHALGKSIVSDSETELLIDLSKANDFFIDFVEKQKIITFLENFKRAFYTAGETIIHQGEEGNEVFLLIEGHVTVSLPKTGSPSLLSELEPGAMFGEIALLTCTRRTANVIAKTDTTVMILERQEFFQQMLQDPLKCLDMLNLLGERLKKTLDQFLLIS